MKKLAFLLAFSLLVGFSKPPKNTENICRIFKSNPTWYWKAKQTEHKWGVPVAVQMAIINQESRFNAEAKAGPSSAYGFSQALKRTWASYQHSTGTNARRNEFAAATDFIGWYVSKTKHYLGISPKNTYALYLAYHEGLGGYKSRSYFRKPSIMRVAHKVDKKANIYQGQLLVCQREIENNWLTTLAANNPTFLTIGLKPQSNFLQARFTKTKLHLSTISFRDNFV